MSPHLSSSAYRSRLRRLRPRRNLIERFERRELMAADLEAITVLNPETQSSNPALITQLGSQLFFNAVTELGRELWKTDGTDAGTMLVKDIFPGQFSGQPTQLTIVGSLLFFTARSVEAGYELWKSDGTSAGTVMVKDINSNPYSSGISNLCNVNGILFCSANADH